MDRKAPALILPAPSSNAPAGGTVGTVGTAGTNTPDIHGIKGPVEIPSSYAWLLWVLAGIAAAVAAWFLWRKFRQRKLAPKPVAIIPPHRKAKDRLRNAEELLSDPYAFCSLVSQVIREYLEDRFDLHAPERTTEEFLSEMRSSSALHPAHKGLLEDFLERCDLVKFARFEPSQSELKALLDAALRFIDETAPVATAGESQPSSAEQRAA
jgi:hypothetical protein